MGERTSGLRRHASLAALVGGLVGVPLALATATGSLAIPHNDAWSHSRIAQVFARTGDIQLLGWNRTSLVGQIVPLGQLGTSVAGQQLFVVVLAAVALVATFGFLSPRLGTGRALFGVAVLGAFPDFALAATTYMSDVPALAAFLVSLWLADLALKKERLGYLAASLAVGVWGVTIREQVLVAVVAALVVTLWSWHGRRRLWAGALGAVAIVAIGAFEVWRRALPLGDNPGLELNFWRAVYSTVGLVLTLALFLAPAVLLVARPLAWSLGSRLVSLASLGVLAVAAAIVQELKGSPFLDNSLALDGAYSAVAVGTRVVLGPALWFALIALACVSGALLVGVLHHARPRVDRLAAVAGLFLLGGTLAQAAAGQHIYSRYLLPLLPLACLALFAVRQRSNRTAGALSLVAMFVLATAITANALSFDAARWHAAEQLQASGLAATDIDAGLEWVGFHAAGPADQSAKSAETGGSGGWYVSMFSGSRACRVVSASELSADEASGAELVATTPYPTFGLFGQSTLWIYRNSCA